MGTQIFSIPPSVMAIELCSVPLLMRDKVTYAVDPRLQSELRFEVPDAVETFLMANFLSPMQFEALLRFTLRLPELDESIVAAYPNALIEVHVPQRFEGAFSIA